MGPTHLGWKRNCYLNITIFGHIQKKKKTGTHMRILQPRILAGQLRSRSTFPCVGHRCPSHCRAVQTAWHSSCSSHIHPGQSSPPGHNMVFADICRATDRTAAFQPQPSCLQKLAAHCFEACWSTVWGGGQISVLSVLANIWLGN